MSKGKPRNATKARKGLPAKAGKRAAATKGRKRLVTRRIKRAVPRVPPMPGVVVDSPAALELELWAAAESHARSLGFEFEQGCEQNFRRLARESFERLGTGLSPASAADVRVNTERLVTAMVIEARAQHADTLHEWTLSGALGKLCPLYPFC
jgi:hypothetical protein